MRENGENINSYEEVNEISNQTREIIMVDILNKITTLAKHENYKGIAHFMLEINISSLTEKELIEMKKDLFYSKNI